MSSIDIVLMTIILLLGVYGMVANRVWAVAISFIGGCAYMFGVFLMYT